jgi:hypothetical protein
VTAYADANAAILDAFRAAGLIRIEGPAESAEAVKATAGLVRDVSQRLKAAGVDLDAARGAFLAAAHRAAGAKLPRE